MLKYLRVFFCKLFVIILIQSSPTKKHNINDKISPKILMFERVAPLKISNSKLAIIIGIDIRKEYFALIAFSPKILDVAMVVPLRLIPGIQAIPCEMPMTIAWR